MSIGDPRYTTAAELQAAEDAKLGAAARWLLAPRDDLEDREPESVRLLFTSIWRAIQKRAGVIEEYKRRKS